jgi:hypothetical protein
MLAVVIGGRVVVVIGLTVDGIAVGFVGVAVDLAVRGFW